MSHPLELKKDFFSEEGNNPEKKEKKSKVQ